MSKIDFMENSIDEIIHLIKNFQLDSAQKRIKALLKKNKHFYVYHLQGLIYLQTEKYGDSIKFFNISTSLKNDFPDAFNGLGVAYTKLGDNLKAIENLKKAILLNPFFVEARLNLANIYFQEKKLFEAEKEILCIFKNEKNNLNVINLLADIKSSQHKIDESINLRHRALEINISSDIYHSLGGDYFNLGDFDNSIMNYKKAYDLKPQSRTLYALSQIPDYEFDQMEINFLQLCFEKNDDLEEKIFAGFALASFYKKNKKFELAYEYLSKANVYKDSIRVFDRKNLENLIVRIKENYLNLNKALPKINISGSNPVPIFILGLPRSGSTLIEQIISNHPDVYGGGELAYIGPIISDLIRKNLLKDNDINKIREEYFSYARNLSNKPFFTDKTPGNFIQLGLLNIIFPEAIIIHTERDLFSTAFSIYENNFIDQKMGWTFNQQNIYQYIKIYKDLMNYWKSYGIKNFVNCNYEHLVKNPVKETKALFNLIGLDFSEKYLDLTKNNRPVFTASRSQVKSKINSEGIDKWKKYGSSIDEFKHLISDI